MKVSDHMKYQRGGRKLENPAPRAERREHVKGLYRQAKRLKAAHKKVQLAS